MIFRFFWQIRANLWTFSRFPLRDSLCFLRGQMTRVSLICLQSAKLHPCWIMQAPSINSQQLPDSVSPSTVCNPGVKYRRSTAQGQNVFHLPKQVDGNAQGNDTRRGMWRKIRGCGGFDTPSWWSLACSQRCQLLLEDFLTQAGISLRTCLQYGAQ